MKNKRKLLKANNSREYNIILKSTDVYCPICNKRYGVFDAYCGGSYNEKIQKNWKLFRKTQYKC